MSVCIESLFLKHYHNLKTIDTFTPQDFSILQDKLLTTKMNTKTINNHLTYIKMFFEYAEKQDYIQKNPVRVDFLKEQKSTKENFTDDEINTLLTTTKIPQHYRDWETDRKSTRLNSSHRSLSRMPSSA